MRSILIAILLAGCGGDDVATAPDATPEPATVLGYLAEGGPWMEDVVWGSGYLPCTGCEELSVFDFDDAGYQIRVYTRDPGEDATLGCTARIDVAESTIDGFDPHDRTRLALTIGDNDCGWTDAGPWAAWIVEVVTRDDDGRPTYLAWWPEIDDAAAEGPFPGYESDGAGHTADPIRLCASAPDPLCEPSCNLAAGGCDLPEP